MKNIKNVVTAIALSGIALAGAGGMGGYAYIGHQAENSLTDMFNSIDEHPAFFIEHSQVEKSITQTTAQALIASHHHNEPVGEINVIVHHGLPASTVLARLTPNQSLFKGEVELRGKAGFNSFDGTLRADYLALENEEGIGVSLETPFARIERSGRAWYVEGVAQGLVFNGGEHVIEMVAPRWEYLYRADEVRQRHDYDVLVPLTTLAQNGRQHWLGSIADARFAGQGVVLDNLLEYIADVSINEIKVDRFSFGGAALSMSASNIDIEALEVFQSHYEALDHNGRASMPLAEQQHHLEGVVDAVHEILSAKPTFIIESLEALGEPPLFETPASFAIQFDGDLLPKTPLYRMAQDSGLALSGDAQEKTAAMTRLEAEFYLLSRLSGGLRVPTPPDILRNMLPVEAQLLIDPARSEQVVMWEEGQLFINGHLTVDLADL